ncbi:MAG TPA: right-handed parallel beta-helix repeat-containing protein, partial [Bacteroidota bacterium]|nr:right-handed parallel beta-helix repeat-containing protein [Bacteroidota bacterium]
MKSSGGVVIALSLMLAVCLPVTARADFPVYQSAGRDRNPAVAYNSQSHEYLVIWIQSEPAAMGPLMGQRLSESGSAVGSAFTIESTVSGTVAVAYNAAQNEFFVAYEYGIAPDIGISGQRLTASGTKTGSRVTLMSIGRRPRLLYNSLSGNYLLLGLNSDLYSRKIGADGQPMAAAQNITNDPGVSYSKYAAAYAPVTSSETPYGRYLVAKYPVSLMMLDSDGKPLNTLYNPQQGYYLASVPMSTGSTVGGEYHVDIAYGDTSGYSMWGKAFLVVWSDHNNKWSGSEWTGIWGSYVDAAKIDYQTTDAVQDHAFPISYIPAHWAYSTYAETWRPVAAFNPVSRKFHVAWRETPGPEAENDTKVNHIRSNSGFFSAPPTSNVVLSQASASDDPGDPAIAVSTKEGRACVVWDDQRNMHTTDHDIYGSVYPLSFKVSTHLGQNVIVDLGFATMLTFSQITGAGLTTVIPYPTGANPPSGQKPVPLAIGGTYLSITTTATFQGSVTVRLTYDDTGLSPSDEAAATVQRYDASLGTWADITSSRDVDQNCVIGETTHFSDFAIMIPASSPSIIWVVNTDDIGPGSLRQAIADANTHSGADTILFAIPMTDPGYHPSPGVWTIKPASPLPALADAGTYIEGLSQTVLIGDKNPSGPEIRIDGALAGATANGLTIRSALNRIGGLCISGFNMNGIYIEGPMADGNIIARCYIGVTPDASAKAPNSKAGIWIVNSALNAIGWLDTASANIIGGNVSAGVVIGGVNARFNVVAANCIGTDFTHKVNLGNEYVGVVFADGASDNSVTGFDYPLNVVIMNNPTAGIAVAGIGTVRNFLGAGCITNNGGKGIFLTLGGNDSIAAPVITTVTSSYVKGTALPRSMVILYNDPGNEGAEYFTTVYADVSGNFQWNGTAKGPHVTAIAVDTTAGATFHNTSAFSAPFAVTAVETPPGPELPQTTALYQNFPNPFNPSTTIRFTVARNAGAASASGSGGSVNEHDGVLSEWVRIAVYDLLGREVAVLVNERKVPGNYSIEWNAGNLASGQYFCRMTVG